MTRFISAPPNFGVETSQDMGGPGHPGQVMPGVARAHLTVYEVGDECASDTLPTVAEMLAAADPQTGLISIERYVGLPLRISADALRGFSPSSRVGPGYSFVTHAALARKAKDESQPTP